VQHASGNQSLLLQEYLEESEDLINEVEKTILDLERNGSQDYLMDPIVSIAHALETMVSHSRQTGGDLDPVLVDISLQCIDALRDLSSELGVSGACKQDVTPILRRIDESELMQHR
jgi:hypothetical protein